LTTGIEAPVQYGNGAGGNLLGCDPFPAGSLAGKIVLVDRGVCSFSIKIANIGAAGGLVGIIGLVAPGDPFEGGYGGGDVTIPGYMISQAVSNRLKSGLPNTVVRFDPAVGIPLAGSMVGSSSRGPQHESTTLIKPEIGAPGASVSAIAGTGTGKALRRHLRRGPHGLRLSRPAPRSLRRNQDHRKRPQPRFIGGSWLEPGRAESPVDEQR
jgi:minor extracellular serine protease Vpr